MCLPGPQVRQRNRATNHRKSKPPSGRLLFTLRDPNSLSLQTNVLNLWPRKLIWCRRALRCRIISCVSCDNIALDVAKTSFLFSWMGTNGKINRRLNCIISILCKWGKELCKERFGERIPLNYFVQGANLDVRGPRTICFNARCTEISILQTVVVIQKLIQFNAWCLNESALPVLPSFSVLSWFYENSTDK